MLQPDKSCPKERYREIYLVNHDPKWSKEYDKEAGRLSALLGSNLVSIHHVGSTAVPDLPAKPVVDILLVVSRLSEVDCISKEIEELGYHALGEYGIEGRRYFWKDQHAAHLHCFEESHPEIGKWLDFRDYLIAHPIEAKKYGDAKYKAAKEHPNDGHAYWHAKSAVVEKILAHAKNWRANGSTRDTTFQKP